MAENWYDRKADNWYDGSSAYKIDEYYSYTEEADKKQKKKRTKVKTAVLNHKKLIMSIGVIFVVAIAFLYANVVLIETATKVDNLNTQLEDVRVRNTQLTYDMAASIDLAEVEDKAINEFGMQYPQAHQNVYAFRILSRRLSMF